ncbi:MAG: hypothetical protein PHH16_03650 [Candidatus Gracilibacteria bacterium]|nr:hypothetical protein [Candidatus Gracilibacteria bacterium]
MHPNKTLRLLLASLLLVSGVLSSTMISSVQADTTSPATLSPAITAKLDAFLVKVQALRSRYPSDIDWNTFLDTLNSKVGALKPQYAGNALILTVLDRLSVGVNGLKAQGDTDAISDDTDLCTKEGLDNIDETNFSMTKNVMRVTDFFPSSDDRALGYKMDVGQSYSFPIMYNTGLYGLNSNPYFTNYPYVVNISDRKCDFVPKKISRIDQCFHMVPTSSQNVGILSDQVYISANEKHADPNYIPDPRKDFGCPILPGKKYYMNIRWLRRSDIIDTSGKVRSDLSPYFSSLSSVLGDIATLSMSELNKKLDGIFNNKDSCLGSGIQGHNCAVDYWELSSGNNLAPHIPKLSK